MRIRTILAIVSVATAAACGSGEGTTPIRTVAKVTISGGTTTLDPGQSTQLTAVVADASGAPVSHSGALLWSSNATTVATVDQSGKVTAVAGGNAVISAEVSKVKGTITIKVNVGTTTSKSPTQS